MRFPILQMVLLELTDFLWFLSGLLQMSPGVFFEKLDRGVDRFGGAVFGIPNWGSRRYVATKFAVNLMDVPYRDWP